MVSSGLFGFQKTMVVCCLEHLFEPLWWTCSDIVVT